MPGANAGSLAPGLTGWAGLAGRVAVGPVWLLGVRVIALARPSLAEHDRRSAAGLGAVTNPALLDRLLDLPAGQPVGDPVVWAETSGLLGSIVDRGDDGYTITRLLEPPLALDGVVVPAGRAGVLRAVQDASLFAGFTCRWVTGTRPTIPRTAVLEAQLCGVGLLNRGGGVVLQAEPPQRRTVDEWSWLLQERTYRRWLRANHERAHPRRGQGNVPRCLTVTALHIGCGTGMTCRCCVRSRRWVIASHTATPMYSVPARPGAAASSGQPG